MEIVLMLAGCAPRIGGTGAMGLCGVWTLFPPVCTPAKVRGRLLRGAAWWGRFFSTVLHRWLQTFHLYGGDDMLFELLLRSVQ